MNTILGKNTHKSQKYEVTLLVKSLSVLSIRKTYTVY